MDSISQFYIILAIIILSSIMYIVKYIIEHKYLSKKEYQDLAIKLKILNKSDDESLYLSTMAKQALLAIKLMLFKLVYIPVSLLIMSLVFGKYPKPFGLHWIFYYLISLILISFIHEGLKSWLGKIRK